MRKIYLLLMSCVLLCVAAGCGGSSKDWAKVKAFIPGDTRAMKLMNIASSSAQLHYATGPVFDEFNCYAVNVMSDDIGKFFADDVIDMAKVRAGASCSTYRGVMSNLVSATTGGTMEVFVPTGASRVIQVMGMKNITGLSCQDAMNTYCNNSSSSATCKSAFSYVYEVGRSTVDVFSDMDVAINKTYDPANPNNIGCSTEYSAYSFDYGANDQIAAGGISASSGFTCAIVSGNSVAASGQIKCWGNGSYGEMGNGTSTPTNVSPSTNAVATGIASATAVVAGGDFACAIDGGAAKCWGNASYGALGNGMSSGTYSTPQNVSTLSSGVTRITAGMFHACALTAGGNAYCWGRNNYGQIGNGTSTSIIATPVSVSGLVSGVLDIKAGGNHTCAVTGIGVVKCWGYNFYGQIGTGTTSPTMYSTIQEVSGLLSTAKKVATGGNFTCVLLNDGAVQCFGYNQFGQIGVSTSIATVITPTVAMNSTYGAYDIVAGEGRVCARTSTNGFYFWGKYPDSASSNTTPTAQAAWPGGITKIADGWSHTCALMNGSMMCWGNNNNGQIGIGNTSTQTAPVNVGSFFP